MNRVRVPDPAAARLQALMPPVSGTPRVPPAPVRQLRPLAWLVAVSTARLTGTGPPAIFTTLGRHPRLFRAWLFYSAHLMPFGTLPRIDSELVILRVAWQCGAAYEWWQHVPLGLRDPVGAERDLVERLGLRILPYFPLASGLLTGKYTGVILQSQIDPEEFQVAVGWAEFPHRATSREDLILALAPEAPASLPGALRGGAPQKGSAETKGSAAGEGLPLPP